MEPDDSGLEIPVEEAAEEEDDTAADESLLKQAGVDDVDDYVLPEALPELTFRNTTQLEPEDIRRLIHLLIRRQKAIRLYRIGIAAFGLFFIGYGILSFVRYLDDGNRANLMSGGLVALLGVGALYLAARGLVNMTTRRVMKSADRFLYRRRYRITPDGLEYQPSGHEPLAVPWSEVSEWTTDSRNFYLMVRGSWFLIARNGFSGDAAERVESLIREQGIATSRAGFRGFGR
ncbi:MAG: YcxB family protein [Bacillota bacterium]|nr:YcxB family protein [Bacillota bacterium]